MIHNLVKILQIVASLGCVSSCLYYILVLWSARAFSRQGSDSLEPRLEREFPPVSILKPLKGVDPEIYESFRSYCRQSYPEYEIIFGVSDPDDPAIAAVQQLQREFPEHAIRLVVCSEKLGANLKVSNLEQMLAWARFDHVLVSDSDIRVEGDYLRRVVAPLRDDKVGVVTCLYRGIAAATLGSRLESLGISTDFSPGVLVAWQLEGGLHFGFGSTLVLRRSNLQQIGGFKSIVDFLADDYELARGISDLGLKVVLSDVVVETHLQPYDFRGYIAHQLRWARAIRDSRPAGYFGLIATFGLTWSLVDLIAARGATWAWVQLVTVAVLRAAVALRVGRTFLKDRQVTKFLWLVPLRDLVGVFVWTASLGGHSITWRGDSFTLKNGKLIRMS
jgi:ceramide glucosyltransferase